jgi:hypothetical protein
MRFVKVLGLQESTVKRHDGVSVLGVQRGRNSIGWRTVWVKIPWYLGGLGPELVCSLSP